MLVGQRVSKTLQGSTKMPLSGCHDTQDDDIHHDRPNHDTQHIRQCYAKCTVMLSVILMSVEAPSVGDDATPFATLLPVNSSKVFVHLIFFFCHALKIVICKTWPIHQLSSVVLQKENSQKISYDKLTMVFRRYSLSLTTLSITTFNTMGDTQRKHLVSLRWVHYWVSYFYNATLCKLVFNKQKQNL